MFASDSDPVILRLHSQVSDTEVRLYYDTFGPGGRFLCVAVSHDGGATFAKPSLGLISFNGSTANNIVAGERLGQQAAVAVMILSGGAVCVRVYVCVRVRAQVEGRVRDAVRISMGVIPTRKERALSPDYPH